jgi:hypothetical protein
MTGVIDLADDEPATIANMIDYFYKGDYGKGPDALDYWYPLMLITHTRACTKASHVNFPFQTTKWLTLVPQAYIIADKYDIPGLKEVARAKYEHIVEKNWEDVSFIWSLKLMYDKTPHSDRALKNIAIKTAAAHVADLIATKEFVRVLHENGEIGSDILKAMLPVDAPTEPMSSKKQVCPLCGELEIFKLRYWNNAMGAPVCCWVSERCLYHDYNVRYLWWTLFSPSA